MANPDKAFTKNLNKQDFNLLMFFNFFIAFVGSVFLAWNSVNAGIIYSLMFVGIMASIFMVMLWLKDDSTLKPITEYVKIPIGTKLTLASAFYLSGLALPLILNLILKITTSYTVVSFAVPLFGADIVGTQSFSSVQYTDQMQWKIFNIMFTAGNMETLVYNFGLVIIGVLIGLFTFNLITDKKNIGFISKKTFVLSFAFGFSVLLFMLSHIMNKSYGTNEFIIAGIFLLVANLSIYLSGIFLAFWAGYHQMNNLIYLVQQEGLQNVAQGFVSWFGLVYLIYLVLIIWYVLNNWEKVKRDLIAWVRN